MKITNEKCKISFVGLPLETFRMPHPKSSVGCYLLYSASNVVVYVGQSLACFERISAHKDKDYAYWEYVPCEIENLDQVEASLIALYKPAYNKFLPQSSGYTHEVTILNKAMSRGISLGDIAKALDGSEKLVFNGKDYYYRDSIDWESIGHEDPMMTI